MQFGLSVRALAEAAGVNYRNFYYLVKKLKESEYGAEINLRLNKTVSIDASVVSAIVGPRRIAIRHPGSAGSAIVETAENTPTRQ